MERLDFEPEDSLMEELEHTILDPWTKDKQIELVKNQKIFNFPPKYLDFEFLDTRDAFKNILLKHCSNLIFPGIEPMSGDSSFPLSCSACVVRHPIYFLKGFYLCFNCDIYFIKNQHGTCRRCSVCRDHFKLEADAVNSAKERTLYHIITHLYLFIYPLVEVFCNLMIARYLILHYLLLFKNFSRPYRRVQSYV